MTSPYRRACRQTNFSEGGFVRKVPFLFFLTFLFYFLFFLPIALSSFFYYVGSWPAGVSPDHTVERRWGVSLFNCWFYIKKALSVKTFIWCGTVRYASKNYKINVCSDLKVDTMPCKCCMHSIDMFHLLTHLMSDVCTFGISLIVLRIHVFITLKIT